MSWIKDVRDMFTKTIKVKYGDKKEMNKMNKNKIRQQYQHYNTTHVLAVAVALINYSLLMVFVLLVWTIYGLCLVSVDNLRSLSG